MSCYYKMCLACTCKCSYCAMFSKSDKTCERVYQTDSLVLSEKFCLLKFISVSDIQFSYNNLFGINFSFSY